MERERQTKAAAFVDRVADQPDPFGALRARRPGRDAAADIEHLRAPDAHPRHRFEIAGHAVGGRIAVPPLPPGVWSRIDRGRFEGVEDTITSLGSSGRRPFERPRAAYGR